MDLRTSSGIQVLCQVCSPCGMHITYVILVTVNISFAFVNAHMIFVLSVIFVCIFYVTFAGSLKINGVSLRHVNQSYVIATSTKVDVSGVDVANMMTNILGGREEEKEDEGG